MFTSTFQTIINEQKQQQPPNNIPPGPNKPSIPPQVRPQICQPPPQQKPSQSIPPQANTPPVSLQLPLTKNRASLQLRPFSAPVPTRTNGASSFQAPKSPNGNVWAKPEAPALKGRRMSKLDQQPLAELLQPPANVGGAKKRLRGPDPSVVNELSPSKRIKTGWGWPPTTDLVSSSSTNPSPESGSEFTDPLRLGTLKEVDGGESTYFHPSEWKWDNPMPMLEQPWAIFTS